MKQDGEGLMGGYQMGKLLGGEKSYRHALVNSNNNNNTKER